MSHPLELDTIDVFTEAHMRERGVVYPTPLLSQCHLVGGGVEEICYTSIALCGDFIRNMNPREVHVYVGKDEDEAALLAAIMSAARGQVH